MIDYASSSHFDVDDAPLLSGSDQVGLPAVGQYGCNVHIKPGASSAAVPVF